ncbi:MAG: MarR family transcriptional regulator [Hyphomicrobiaceae bacterium]|nr:MarR family transcriptional regulator [Hyphomicrobiaceae bacterium]
MPSDDEKYIGYLIADVARLLRTVFDRRVRRLGLTRAQWLALTRLNRRPGLSQSEVADMLEIEKATACRLIDRLESKRWIERRPDKKDRRIKRIHLTARAIRVHASIWPVAEKTVDDALSDLSPDERRQFTDLMARVKGKLQALAESDLAAATPEAQSENEARVL